MSEVSCGKVTLEERDEIRRLHRHRIALIELMASVAKLEPAEMDRIYTKLVEDMGNVIAESHGWWERKAELYEWKSIKGKSWRIDFDTCEVFLQM